MVCFCLLTGAVAVAFFAGLHFLLKICGFADKSKTELRGLKGKHIVITGGSSGIGKSLGMLAVENGANVTLIARDESKLQKAVDEFRSLSSGSSGSVKISYYSVDVSKDHEKVDEVINNATNANGPIDILVCCAGTSVSGRFEDTPISDFKSMMDVNYFGTVYPIKSVVPLMKARRNGKIVVVSSVVGMFGLYGYTAYSASKYALRGLAESLQMELTPYNVGVTMCMPPDTDTPGYEEEMKTKPLETKLISEAGGLVHPDAVAQKLYKDVMKGKFLSTIGFENELVALVCAGASPVVSFFQLAVEAFSMGAIRIIVAVILLRFNWILKKCMRQRDSSKKAD